MGLLMSKKCWLLDYNLKLIKDLLNSTRFSTLVLASDWSLRRRSAWDCVFACKDRNGQLPFSRRRPCTKAETLICEDSVVVAVTAGLL